MNPTSEDKSIGPKGIARWLDLPGTKILLFVVLATLALPPRFAILPSLGLDASWKLSLQMAVQDNRIFGQQFVFTYGPLGYLLVHAVANKGALLLYDLFVLGSLLSIYRDFLPPRPRVLEVILVIAVAAITKTTLWINPDAVLFTILCYWLWRIYDRGGVLATAGGLVAALILFFGKVNFGLVMVFLVPAYATGLAVLHRQRRAHGIFLLLGFFLLVWFGAMVWRVDIPNYLRSGRELIAGYNEAMFISHIKPLITFEISCAFLLAMGTVAWLGRNQLSWRGQVLVLPLVAIATLAFFKNAFVRSDGMHVCSWFGVLPLFLTVWSVSWRRSDHFHVLLLASLTCYSIAVLTREADFSEHTKLGEYLPWRYLQQAAALPRREDAAYLQNSLRASAPESVMPANVQSLVGSASVDVMPMQPSIAILNGLNYQPRPIPQSYAAYTAWLDNLNAKFFDSSNAPVWLLYVGSGLTTIDNRPAAWDEALTKISLLDNYNYESEFPLPILTGPDGPQKTKPVTVYLMKRAGHLTRLDPVATNQVTLSMGQPLLIPKTTNLIFLTLEVNRSILGKLKASALSPDMLTVAFKYDDGSTTNYRAILPILKTRVLVNRRVESSEEIRHWLEKNTAENMGVSSLYFTSTAPWAFYPPFKGTLTEYRFVSSPNHRLPN